MMEFILAIFTVFPVFVFGEDECSFLELPTGKKPILSDYFFEITFYLFIVFGAYFLITLFLGLFCCKPSKSAKPNGFHIFSHIFTSCIVLCAVIVYFIALQRLLVKKSESSSKKTDENRISLALPIDQNQKNIDELYEHLSSLNEHYLYSSNMLKKITLHYNDYFSKENSQYRTAYNYLYSKNNHDSDLKYNLEKMEISRETILSNIISFSDRCIQFSTMIQNTLKNIKQDYPELFITTQSVNTQSYSNIILVTLSYVFISFIIFFVLIYFIFFFYNVLFTRMLFCFYPFFMIVILLLGFFSGFYIKKQKYHSILEQCELRGNKSANSELNINMINLFNIESITNDLYRFINSKKIHENYPLILVHDQSDEKIQQKLNEMIQIIESEEKTLRQMRTLIQKISKTTFSIHPLFQKLIEKVQFKSKSIETNSKQENVISKCDDLIEGCNFSIIASLLMFFGNFLFSISVCVRRKTIKKVQISASDGEIEEDEENGSFVFKTYKYSSREMYFIFYLSDDKEPDVSFFVKNGSYGPGFYFSASPGEAFIQWYLANMNDEHIVDDSLLRNIYVFKCFVYFGKSVDVPSDKAKCFKYPDTVEKYKCQSVIGHHADGEPTEFVIYEAKRFEILEHSHYNSTLSINQINQLVRSLK